MSTGVRREILLNPGPVNVSDRVRSALVRGDLCHREPEFQKLMTGVRRSLEDLFAPGKTHVAILVAGSGTSAVEAMIASVAPRGQKLAVVSNGVYGERIIDIATRHGLDVLPVVPEGSPVGKVPPGVSPTWLSIPSRAQIEAVLDRKDVAGLAAVHHETTTGLLNPIAEWGALAKARGKRFLVDSVSGMAGEELDLAAWGIDAVACTANKCIQGIPGSSFVLVRREVLTEKPRTLYLDLVKNLEAQEKGFPAFTQPVQVLFAFEAALEELREETVSGRVARMKRASQQLRTGFKDLGLDLLLPEAVRSNTITTLSLPRGVTYPALHDALKARGFVIYAGQGGLEKSVFRVANMGALGEADFAAFLGALAPCLRQP
ncbi:MAG: alanine--glyoxylate aminotransferase family protein, partial [Planctomycetota bacterium]